jgi:hypothetical protein
MAGILKVDQYQDFNGNTIMTSDGSGNITINNTALKNTPAFGAKLLLDTPLTISHQTTTTILFSEKILDTDNCYSTSTGKFIPTTSGKYFLTTNVKLQSGNMSNYSFGFIDIKKNGTSVAQGTFDGRNGNDSRASAPAISVIQDLNGSSDEIMVTAYISTVNSAAGTLDVGSTFSGYKLIGA